MRHPVFSQQSKGLLLIQTHQPGVYCFSMPWLVLLVDDNALFRRAVKQLFTDESDFEIVGEAEHGAEAIDRAITLHPHLIILDFAMPTMNGPCRSAYSARTAARSAHYYANALCWRRARSFGSQGWHSCTGVQESSCNAFTSYCARAFQRTTDTEWEQRDIINPYKLFLT